MFFSRNQPRYIWQHSNKISLIFIYFAYIPLFFGCCFYRVSYSILKNQFATYEDLQVDNSADQVEIKNLSPGSTYTFRFNVQMGPMSGPSVLLKVFIIFVFIYFTTIFIQILLEKYLNNSSIISKTAFPHKRIKLWLKVWYNMVKLSVVQFYPF